MATSSSVFRKFPKVFSPEKTKENFTKKKPKTAQKKHKKRPFNN
jgi:hypothetical protein